MIEPRTAVVGKAVGIERLLVLRVEQRNHERIRLLNAGVAELPDQLGDLATAARSDVAGIVEHRIKHRDRRGGDQRLHQVAQQRCRHHAAERSPRSIVLCMR